jgi:hypothetical protein
VEPITSPNTEAASAPAAARERGWRLILPALGLFLLVPAFAALRVLVPVEQTILLVGPAIGVCALVAWVQGGRVWLALTWLLLSAWMLIRPLDDGSAFEFMARGWAIVLVSMFGIACMLGGRRFFLSRALSAVAASSSSLERSCWFRMFRQPAYNERCPTNSTVARRP